MSGTQGGDLHSVLLDVYSGAVQDVATNLNLNNFGITVTETADTTNPFFISGVIDYNNGILVINASETIDTTPRSYVNLADFYLTKKHPTTKTSGDHVNNGHVQLTGSAVLSDDTVLGISIQLSEAERVAAISYSATPGGEDVANPTELDVEVGGFRDVATNLNVELIGLQLSEIADITKPLGDSAIIRLTDGVILLTLSETIRTSTVLFNLIDINNITQTEEIALPGATVTGSDLPTISIQLTESMRARAVEISGTPGGDNHASILNISSGAMKDMAGNDIVAIELLLSELGDVGQPRMKSASIQLTEGILIIELNETIDVTPVSLFNLDTAFLSDLSHGLDIPLTGSVLTEIDSTSLTARLTEMQRVEAIVRSDLLGGNIDPMHFNTQPGTFVDLAGNNNTHVNVVVTEFADTGNPFLINATINYGIGELILFFQRNHKMRSFKCSGHN